MRPQLFDLIWQRTKDHRIAWQDTVSYARANERDVIYLAHLRGKDVFDPVCLQVQLYQYGGDQSLHLFVCNRHGQQQVAATPLQLRDLYELILAKVRVTALDETRAFLEAM